VTIPTVYLAPQLGTDADQLVCEVDTGGNGHFLQNYTVNLTGTNAWDQLQTAENFDQVLGQAMGKATAASFPGLYQLTAVNGLLGLNYVPLGSFFGPPTIIKMSAPAGATRIATLAVDDENNTNLFVAAKGGIYLYTPDQQTNGGTGTLVVATDLVDGVQDFFAQQTDTDVAVWGLNQQGQVFYVRCPKGSETTTTAWSTPLPIYENVARISAYINQQTGGIVIFMHTQEQDIVQASQAPQTTTWQQRNILLPPPDYTAMIDFNAYSTHITVTDSNGYAAPNAKVHLTATSDCSVFVNDVYHLLSPTVPITVETDAVGVLTIVQETQNISAICYGVKFDGTAALPINPMNKALSTQLNKVQSEKDLMGITVSDGKGGTKPLVDPNLDKGKQTSTVNALKQFVAIGGKLPSDGSVVQPTSNAARGTTAFVATAETIWGVTRDGDTWTYHEGANAHQHLQARFAAGQMAGRGTLAATDGALEGIGTFFGDLWNWLKSVFEEVTSYYVKFIDGVYHFFVELGKTIYRAVVNCIAEVFHAIEFVFQQIAVLFEDLVKWIGFLFNWGDIVRTHKVIKNIFTQYVQKSLDSLDGYKGDIKTQFTEMITFIDQWAGIETNIPANLQGQTAGQLNQSNPPPGGNTPEYNYGVYQTKTNMGDGNTDAQPTLTGDIEAIIQPLLDLLQTEEAILGTALAQLKTQVIDKLNERSMGQILKAIVAIIADTLLETVENLLLTLIDILKALAQGILDLMRATIQIPVISSLYKAISGGEELSFLDLVALVAAIPTTLGYKLIANTTPFPDNATTTALIKAKSFKEIQDICNGRHALAGTAPTLAAVAARGANSDPTPLQQVALAGGIMSGIGAIALSIISPFKKRNPNALLDWLNAFFYLPYVSPDIMGQIPDLQERRWYAIMNQIIADVATVKTVIVDLAVARKAKTATAEKWGIASAWIDFGLNAVWLVPTVGPIFYPEYQNDAGALGVIGGIGFDFSGILSPIIAEDEEPDSLVAVFVLNGIANGIYLVGSLASGILIFDGD
jgi:hypothetical protein